VGHRAQERQSRILDAMVVAGAVVVAGFAVGAVVVLVADSCQEPGNEQRHSED